MYYSQHDQDKILNENFFKGNKNGVFCDVGAHDGETISNTLFFEESLYWTGLCIEAKPENYVKLNKRRKSNNVFGAGYNRNGTITFTSNEGYTNMLSGVTEQYSNSHIERIKREIEQCGGSSKQIEIPCYTLDSLFDLYNFKTIDYLTIDTEGSELQVLQGINFDKFKINVIDFEVNYPNSDEHENIKKLLLDKGFKFWNTIRGDEVWVNNQIIWSWD